MAILVPAFFGNCRLLLVPAPLYVGKPKPIVNDYNRFLKTEVPTGRLRYDFHSVVLGSLSILAVRYICRNEETTAYCFNIMYPKNK